MVRKNHRAKTAKVDGIVNAQYTQNLLVMVGSSFQSNDGTANSAAKKVPGRNVIVIIATIFIAELSSCAFLLKLILARASLLVAVLNT